MNPFRFRIVAEWSDEAGAFVAHVPALPGCTARGSTPEKAVGAVRIAAQRILVAARASGVAQPAEDTASARKRRKAAALRRLLKDLGADKISAKQMAAARAELFGE
jgi:predicted RNase H-like HicB family nuclease